MAGVCMVWLRRLAGLLAALLLCGCTVHAAAPAFSGRATAPLLGPATPLRLGVDEVTLLRGGPGTFAVLRSLIDTAQRSVEVEVYELGNPDLVAALLAAHEHGVVVTVIDDPSEQHSAVTALRLRGAGIDVVDYPVRRLMIDHVKLLVVD